jgi:hypothetical protein
MTIEHGHAFCDGQHSDPAVVPVDNPKFAEWEEVPFAGKAAHLCPRCIERRDKGWLAEPIVLECVECGRNTLDNPETKQLIWTRDEERDVDLCGDCSGWGRSKSRAG